VTIKPLRWRASVAVPTRSGKTATRRLLGEDGLTALIGHKRLSMLGGSLVRAGQASNIT
jgi:hypothetical protein